MRAATILMLFLVLAGSAQADLLGRYRLPGNGLLDIFYEDEDNLRVNIPNQGYLLLDGEQLYLVVEKAGMRMAMNLEQIGQMGSALRSQVVGPEQSSSELVPTIKDTGRHETVAGIKGRVHQVTTGKRETWVVLTNHPDVVKITEGFITAALRVSAVMSPEDREAAAAAVKQLERSGYGGLLKQAGGVQLESIETVERPSHFYQLPPNTPLIQIPLFDQTPK